MSTTRETRKPTPLPVETPTDRASCPQVTVAFDPAGGLSQSTWVLFQRTGPESIEVLASGNGEPPMIDPTQAIDQFIAGVRRDFSNRVRQFKGISAHVHLQKALRNQRAIILGDDAKATGD